MKTIKIPRKEIIAISSSLCDPWKLRVFSLLIEHEGKKDISVSDTILKEAWEVADIDKKKWLRKYYDTVKEVDILSKIDDYSSICRLLETKKLTVKDFSFLPIDQREKALAHHQIKSIETLVNGDWRVDICNPNQYKYYPYFSKRSCGLVFLSSGSDYGLCSGQVGYYKDRNTSDFVGRKFLHIYAKLY